MIYIVLPAYNEELNIKIVLDDLYKLWNEKLKNYTIVVVIVNDGSSDNTEKVIDDFINFLSNKNLMFVVKKINHKSNEGLGKAIKSGFEYVLQASEKNEILVTLDCDNTMPVDLIELMVKKINSGKELIVASRFTNNSKVMGVPLNRKILSYGASALYKVFFPINNIKDYTCGYRAYKVEILKKASENFKPFFTERGFSAMVDILLKLQKSNININAEEVPLTLRYDLKQGKSKMKVFNNIINSFTLILKRKFIK